MVIQGPSKALKAAAWLKDKGWEYTVEVRNHSPFSGTYDFKLNNRQQEFIFELTWAS
jgi:hypothetical protein